MVKKYLMHRVARMIRIMNRVEVRVSLRSYVAEIQEVPEVSEQFRVTI